MNISKSLIIATAESYTREELLKKRKECVEKLAQMEYITTASTGAGASYTMAQRATCEEMIDLYTAAINYLDGQEPKSGAQVFSPFYY